MMHDLFESEHTEVLARVVWARKRPSFAWLIIAALTFAGAVAITLLAPAPVETVERTTIKSLDTVAAELGTTVDTAAAAAHARINKLAQANVMRAAILTDAATVADVMHDELKITLATGEELEVFQVHDGKTQSLIRMPTAAASLPTVKDPAVAIVHISDGAVKVVVGAPIAKIKDGEEYGLDRTGEIVLAVPVDLDVIRTHLAEHAKAALLEVAGVSHPIVPASQSGAGIRVKVPSKTAELSLAVVPMSTSHRVTWLNPVRYCVVGIGATMLLVFALIFVIRKPVPKRY
jgi:hypothetical protein